MCFKKLRKINKRTQVLIDIALVLFIVAIGVFFYGFSTGQIRGLAASYNGQIKGSVTLLNAAAGANTNHLKAVLEGYNFVMNPAKSQDFNGGNTFSFSGLDSSKKYKLTLKANDLNYYYPFVPRIIDLDSDADHIFDTGLISMRQSPVLTGTLINSATGKVLSSYKITVCQYNAYNTCLDVPPNSATTNSAGWFRITPVSVSYGWVKASSPFNLKKVLTGKITFTLPEPNTPSLKW